MIKKIDANEYGVVKYAITSVDELNRLPKKIAPSSQAILIENGLRVFVYGDGQWVEEVVDGDLSENMRSIVADYERSKVGYDGVKRGSLEERLKDDFQGIYDILNARDYCEYSGKELKVDNTWMGNQIDTRVEGRTLQNVTHNYVYNIRANGNIISDSTIVRDTNYIRVDFNGSYNYTYAYIMLGVLKNTLIKDKTRYTVFLDVDTNLDREKMEFSIRNGDGLACVSNVCLLKDNNKGVLLDIDFSKSSIGKDSQVIYIWLPSISTGNYVEIKNLVILEGDHTQTPLSELPYFEGIESVGERDIGKNLFDGVLEPGSYDVNGTPAGGVRAIRSKNYIEIDSNKQYCISLKEYSSYFYIHCYDKDKKNIGEVSTKSSFKPLEGCKYITFNTYNGVTTDLNSPIQLEEGTQVTAYEPFGYKIKGKSCGKNLCIGEGNYHGFYDDTINAYHPINNKQPLSFNLKPNTTYTRILYNCEYEGSPLRMYDAVYETDGAYKQYPYTLTTPTCIATFTTGEKGGKNVYTFNPDNRATVKSGFSLKVGKLVILEGDYTQTSLEELLYEPYQESTYSIHSPIPLRSLPNGVCDVYDFESGAVIQKVGKVVLDGSENWLGYESYDDDVTKWFQVDGLIKANNRFLSCISDKFICVMSSTHTLTGVGEVLSISPTSNGRLNLRINKDKLSSLDVNGFKLWLQVNPTTVYYELVEPIIHYLTPSQLKSFDGTTHVISENTLIPTTTTKILTDTYTNVSNVNSTAYSLRRGVNNVAETSAIINETDVEQDDVLDITMCAIDELYSMLEPNLE